MTALQAAVVCSRLVILCLALSAVSSWWGFFALAVFFVWLTAIFLSL